MRQANPASILARAQAEDIRDMQAELGLMNRLPDQHRKAYMLMLKRRGMGSILNQALRDAGMEDIAKLARFRAVQTGA